MSISEAAKVVGVAPGTLRRWEREGKIKPERTAGGNRRYTLAMPKPHMAHRSTVEKKTIAYARVSSHDQKADLERQKQMLEMYCAAQGWQFEIVADLGSGMNYHKRGLRKLLSMILDEKINRLVLEYDLIGIEDLNVRGMVRNRHLARSIMDQSFHEIRRQLEYKAGWYGAQMVVADRFFPSTKMCSGCGAVHDMPLSSRTMRCGCGLEIDRDLNAAINLERYASTGSSSGMLAPANIGPT